MRARGHQDQDDDARTSAEVTRPTPAAPRPLSARTVRFYARDWVGFVAWCRGAGTVPLPADTATLAAYLTAASARLSPGTVARRLAAIAERHRRHGLVAPITAPIVRAALRAAHTAAAPRRAPLPAPALLARMISGCPGDLAGLRDRAVLSLMAATGLGRAALVSLDAENIGQSAEGCELRLGGEGGCNSVRLSRHPDPATCPVRALQDWLRVSDTGFGPVFRKVDRWGNLEHHRLGADALRRILARRAPARRTR